MQVLLPGKRFCSTLQVSDIWGWLQQLFQQHLFAYLGMILTRLGSRLRTTSHKEVIYQISGRVLGTIIDYIIIFTLFGVGVVMVAGAGSNLQQQFGITAIRRKSIDGCIDLPYNS